MCRCRAWSRRPASRWSGKRRSPSGLAGLDPVGAGAVARGDVRDPAHARLQDFLEQLDLGATGGRVARGRAKDRAVRLAELKRPVHPVERRGATEVAGLVLDDSQLPDALGERGRRPQRLREAGPDPLTEEPPTRLEDFFHELVAAYHSDRLEEGRGEPTIIRGKAVLRFCRHVIQVAWPAHTMADGLADDRAARLEPAQALQDAGTAGADAGRDPVRRTRAQVAQDNQDRAVQAVVGSLRCGPRSSKRGRTAGRVDHVERLAPDSNRSRQPPTEARFSAVRSASLNVDVHGPLPASTYGGSSTDPKAAASVT